MALNNTENEIIKFLKEKPNSKAADIARKFKLEKSDVNSMLYRNNSLKPYVQQNKKYQWSLRKSNSSRLSRSKESRKKIITNSDENLQKLSKYYLSCIGHDNLNISVFARSKYDYDYIELKNFSPDTSALNDSEEFTKILRSAQSDRGRSSIYFGYPINLRKITSSKGEFYFVDPVFIFSIEQNDKKEYEIDNKSISINSSVVKMYEKLSNDEMMSEIANLEDDLGLNIEDGDIPDINDLTFRLKEIKPEWMWKEEINSEKLSDGDKISEIDEIGIYNKAVILKSPKSPFTKGLESELKELGNQSSENLKKSILYKFIHSGDISNSEKPFDEENLITPLPINAEQKDAVLSSLRNPITIVTGPPGTGKSQVVSNILINAAIQNKSVLFASKNNKAVDVVEHRINNLGPREILVRHGSGAYKTKILEYIISLSSTKCLETDILKFEDLKEIQKNDYVSIKQLDREIDMVISLRNELDKLEQAIEPFREDIERTEFLELKNFSLSGLESSTKDIFSQIFKSIDKISYKDENIIKKFLWLFVDEKKYIEDLLNNIKSANKKINIFTQHKFFKSYDFFNKNDIEDFKNDYLSYKEKIKNFDKIQNYFLKLRNFNEKKNINDIYKEKLRLSKILEDRSSELWNLWLKTQVIGQTADRKKLQDYKTLLQIMTESGGKDYLDREIYKQYNDIQKEYASKIPCWAITALSAKGKIPFEPGVFDLVIFDEASQCDIASALPLLFRAKSAVVIGDPKQLTHISTLNKGHDIKLLSNNNLDKDYINWAYSYNSLYDLVSGYGSDKSLIKLRDHHRSHKDIINFSNNQFYEQDLRVATNYDNLILPSKKEAGIRWVNIQGLCKQHKQGGSINNIEANAVINELERLILKNNYKGTIGVVTPFRQQANLINEMALKNEKIADKLIRKNFICNTVHKFQGDEKDVMIFSPVISKNVPKGSLGFLRNNGNLFNVAITRARAQLIVVGDFAECSHSEVDYIENFSKYVSELSEIIPDEVEDGQVLINKLNEKYPEVTNKDQVSEWEIYFYEELYKSGIKAIPQYKVEKYSLDFAILKKDKKLNIEIDGERYHKDWNGELCRRDIIRNNRLAEQGWDVKRFWVYQVRDSLDECILEIKNWIDKSN